MKEIIAWCRAIQDSPTPVCVDCTLNVSWSRVYSSETHSYEPKRKFEITVQSNNACVGKDEDTGTAGYHNYEFREDRVTRKEIAAIKAELRKILPKYITRSTTSTTTAAIATAKE